jgi:hypothetical protein
VFRSLANVALFLVAFSATTGAIREAAPERLKNEWFKKHKDAYEMVFLGSSHVYRQIDPEVLDSSLSARGHDLRSFNFGVPGMRFPEALYMAHRILDLAPKNLRFLVVELGDWRTDIREENLLTERMIYWHSLPITLQLVSAIWSEDLRIEERFLRSWTHLHHMGLRLGNVDQGLSLWNFLSKGEREPFQQGNGILRPGLGQGGNGYRPLDLESKKKTFRQRRQEFLNDLPGFRKAKTELRQKEWGGEKDSYLANAIDGLRKHGESLGVEVLYVVLPGYEKPEGWLQLHQDGHIPLFLAFNDPDAYSELYLAKHRWDLFHLNEAGAYLLSHALANELANWLETRDTQENTHVVH